MPRYPVELVAKAEYELRVFERVSRDTGVELLAEVIAWRQRYPDLGIQPDGSIAPKSQAVPG